MTVKDLFPWCASCAPPAALRRCCRSEVNGLAYDSRKVEAQDILFFAFAGAKADGAQFANAAVANGAIAVVSDRPRPPDFSRPWIQVVHGRQALATASHEISTESRTNGLALTGVTGTNGKTTSNLLDRCHSASGREDDRADRHH